MPQSLSQIKALILKDLRIEWRLRYTLNGLLLYVVSSIFICYLSFNLKAGAISPTTWNALFWIILLFTATNSIGRSMDRENGDRFYFYYTLVRPQVFIMAKALYNSLIMLVLSFTGLLFYLLIMGNPVQDIPLFLFNIFLGALGFAGSLTMIAGIARKAANSSSLVAVLGFPIILPMILMLIKISKNAIDGLARRVSYDEIITLLALNAIVFTLSYILFPYLWKE